MSNPSEAPSLLALHTTEPEASIAIAHRGRIITESFEAAGKDAPIVLEAVLRALERAGTTLPDIAAIAVTTGPGSFTGIRIGLATAQGLAAARDWPVWACDSLWARAAAWRGTPDPVAVVLDARRGEVYAALYDASGAAPRTLVEPFCAAPEVAASRLEWATRRSTGSGTGWGDREDTTDSSSRPLRGQSSLWLTGSGSALVVPYLAHNPEARSLGEAPEPVAAALLHLVRAGGCTRLAAHELEPTYLRKSDAEVRRDSLLRPRA